MSLTVPALAVLGFTAQELTMWRVTLGIGVVVIAVVIVLLTFLMKTVQDIDAAVSDVLDAAVAVAGNTSHLEALLVTNEAVAELKEEALRHAALVEAL
jgi:nitrate/nitrite transporter NarK